MSNLDSLLAIGQSIWFDYIQKSLIREGKLEKLINLGIRGVTSNPSIFEKAISGSSDYDNLITTMYEAQASDEKIYEALSMEDVGEAADLFGPLYESSNGEDGYVSIEVNPKLAYDTAGTVVEARRFFEQIDRPNIMIKVPATKEGLPAIRELIGSGINVNATLMFSENHYRGVSEAYISGLELLRSRGGDISGMASVASFFISRVDTATDALLAESGHIDLCGKVSIANAKNVYRIAQEIFSGDRWDELAWSGAKTQRLLWASTGTKNPDYPDTLYVDELIGENTVNTLPPSTLSFFMDHGAVRETVGYGVQEAMRILRQVEDAGISLEKISEDLQKDGVQAFINSYDNLLKTISFKKRSLAV